MEHGLENRVSSGFPIYPNMEPQNTNIKRTILGNFEIVNKRYETINEYLSSKHPLQIK